MAETGERSSPDLRSQDRRPRADLGGQEIIRGAHPGDVIIRQPRRVGPFRRVFGRPGAVLEATREAEVPRTAIGRAFEAIKRVLIGEPIPSEHAIHERLTNVKALAVLSSDALSSVAYATEEIIRTLILAGMAALQLTMPIGIAVMVLLAIVASSYRQTIAAYPRGGGSYIVAKDNLGTLPGLTAAASILIDYTMTVAVSISAGIAAIYSLFPELRPIRVELCLAVIALITIANLRGIREAGNIFSVPTYAFIVGVLALIAYGLARLYLGLGGSPQYTPPPLVVPAGAEPLTLFLILRAFTQGCTALTGVEAIADGVPAFKPPEAQNARRTLVWLAVLAITMFGGTTFLASRLHILPSEQETVLSQLARTIFGAGPLWFYTNFATALILVLAANTAFSDFPRLSYFLARDRFMPRQYAFRGDRLAFSWGIVTLAAVASILVVVFNGDTTALIPLYTVGVFNSFTLSQSGMVVRWWRTRSPGWLRSMLINGLGAVTTAIVLVVSAVTKFEHGAWIVIVLIPVLILMFLGINRHYRQVEMELAPPARPVHRTFRHTFIVPVASLNKPTLDALDYARSLSPHVIAVHIVEGEDPEETERFMEQWRKYMGNTDIQLAVIESPYRSFLGPLLAYIDAIDRQDPGDTITIILPEAVPTRPWEYFLHAQTALRLKAALLFRPNTVLADMPYLLGTAEEARRAARRRGVLLAFPWVPVFMLLVVLYLVYRYIFP
jgi:amino acid transporter